MRDYGILPKLCTSGERVASVYLALQPEPLGTGQELSLRWRAMQSLLLDAGANAEELRTLDDRIAASAAAPRTLVAFAIDGRLAHADELVDCDIEDTCDYGFAPVIAPLLQWHQQWVPYVVVRTDRTGADLAAYAGAGDAVVTDVVVGLDDEVERNAPGGFDGLAQPRYQHRAEDSWAHNAGQVAAHVTRLAAQVGAKAILVSGDVRATQLLAERLPTHLRDIEHTVTSGLDHSAPGRAQVRRDTAVRLVHDVAARHRAEVVAAFREARGTKESVEGLADTLEALRRSAVGHLLVVRRPTDIRRAWVWPDPLRIADSDGDAQDAGESGEQARLVDAVIRAAFAQGADVTVFDADEAALADDVAALVRF